MPEEIRSFASIQCEGLTPVSRFKILLKFAIIGGRFQPVVGKCVVR
jgi:hypothetical protein